MVNLIVGFIAGMVVMALIFAHYEVKRAKQRAKQAEYLSNFTPVYLQLPDVTPPRPPKGKPTLKVVK